MSQSQQTPVPRVAWLIGQSGYENAEFKPPPGKRSYAAHDVKALAEQLGRLGYEIHVVHNATKADFDDLPRRIVESLHGRRDAILWIYYAGHGHMCNGQQWLVPTDASSKDSSGWVHLYDLIRPPYAMASTSTKVNQEAGLPCQTAPAPKCRVCVFLDCCRDKPKVPAVEGSCPVKELMAGHRPPRPAPELCIFYACQENQVAYENEDSQLGFFTSAVLYALKKPGLNLARFLDVCTERCHKRAEGKQRQQKPVYYNSASLKLVFHPQTDQYYGLSAGPASGDSAGSDEPRQEAEKDVVHEQALKTLPLLVEVGDVGQHGPEWKVALKFATDYARAHPEVGTIDWEPPPTDGAVIWGTNTYIALYDRNRFTWRFFDFVSEKGDAHHTVELPHPD